MSILKDVPPTPEDIGRWVTYIPTHGRSDGADDVAGKLKNFNLELETGFVVFSANGKLNTDDQWQDYTGQSVRFDLLHWGKDRAES